MLDPLQTISLLNLEGTKPQYVLYLYKNPRNEGWSGFGLHSHFSARAFVRFWNLEGLYYFYIVLSQTLKSWRGEVAKAPLPTLTTPLPILQLDQASSSPSQLIFGGTQRLYFALLLMFDSGFKSSIAFKGHFATCSKGLWFIRFHPSHTTIGKVFLPLIQSQILCLASLWHPHTVTKRLVA